MPVFNRKDLVKEAISSVLAQTHEHWELILVDDGSTDGAAELCSSISESDKRIRFFKRDQNNKGASVCRNTGIKHASGDFLLFLDSDDLLAPYCLEQRIRMTEQFPALDFYVFPMLLFKERIDDMLLLQNIPTPQDALDRFLLRENVWLVSSPLWKTEVIRALNGFTSSYLSYQDWELNVRALIMGFKYRFFNEARPDHFYRQHEQTISGSRFTQPYNVSNAQMIIDVCGLLVREHLLNEPRRCALAGFLVEVIKRSKLLSIPVKDIRAFAAHFSEEAKKAGLFNEQERSTVMAYMRWHTTKLAYRFPWFKNRIESHYRTNKLAHFFPAHISNQVKHIYKGSLA